MPLRHLPDLHPGVPAVWNARVSPEDQLTDQFNLYRALAGVDNVATQSALIS